MSGPAKVAVTGSHLKILVRAGEMAHWVNVLSANSADLSLIPGSYLVERVNQVLQVVV